MIDVLERITYYRKQKNWSEYQLAEHSGLTQSTISSWYRKNMVPTIPLTDCQKELLKEAGHLTKIQQLALIEFFKTL